MKKSTMVIAVLMILFIVSITEEECRQYAYDNYTDKEQGEMCLMDWEAREWCV